MKPLSYYIYWVQELKDKYVLLGGLDGKVLMIDKSTNNITKIEGIDETTFSAITLEDQLIIGGKSTIYFFNTSTL